MVSSFRLQSPPPPPPHLPEIRDSTLGLLSRGPWNLCGPLVMFPRLVSDSESPPGTERGKEHHSCCWMVLYLCKRLGQVHSHSSPLISTSCIWYFPHIICSPRVFLVAAAFLVLIFVVVFESSAFCIPVVVAGSINIIIIIVLMVVNVKSKDCAGTTALHLKLTRKEHLVQKTSCVLPSLSLSLILYSHTDKLSSPGPCLPQSLLLHFLLTHWARPYHFTDLDHHQFTVIIATSSIDTYRELAAVAALNKRNFFASYRPRGGRERGRPIQSPAQYHQSHSISVDSVRRSLLRGESSRSSNKLIC